MSVGVNSPLSYLLDMHRHAHEINHLRPYEFGMLAKEQIFSEIQSTGYCVNGTYTPLLELVLLFCLSELTA